MVIRTGRPRLETANVPLQRGPNVRQNVFPAARFILPEQARGRIPGAVHPVEQPAPVRNERQQHPDRFRQRAGQMGYAGIDRNNKIEIGDQRRGIGEILQLLAEMNEIAPAPAARWCRPFRTSRWRLTKIRVDVRKQRTGTG